MGITRFLKKSRISNEIEILDNEEKDELTTKKN